MRLPAVLDEVADAVGRLDPDGAIAPANKVMAALLAALGSPTVAALVAQATDDDALARLTAGEAIQLHIDAAHWRLRQVTADGANWLIAHDATGSEQAASLRWERARARQLAQLAAAIVHDLNNHLNASLALAASARAGAAPEDRRHVDALNEATQRGAGLLRALARLLARAPARERIDLRTLLAEVVAMVDKMARGGGTELSVVHPAGAAMVRMRAAEAQQSLLAGFVRLLGLAAARIEVALAPAEASVAGGRPRHGWQVRCRGLGVDAAAARSTVAAVGLAPDRRPGPDDAASRELVGALLLQRRLGGDLTLHAAGSALQLDYWWPAAVAGAAGAGAAGVDGCP